MAGLGPLAKQIPRRTQLVGEGVLRSRVRRQLKYDLFGVPNGEYGSKCVWRLLRDSEGPLELVRDFW